MNALREFEKVLGNGDVAIESAAAPAPFEARNLPEMGRR